MAIGEGKSVTIIGAGLAGSLLACSLAKLGFAVTVYERRSDPRAAGYAGGRSINLALSARGLWAMEYVGVAQEVMKHAIPMKGRMIHARDAVAGPQLQPYSHDPKDAINSISRGGLNIALLDAAEKHSNVRIVFSHRCLDIDPDRCVAQFQDESAGGPSGPVVEIESDLIIGADGAFSPVRGRLQKTDRFEYSQTYLSHGYKELHIPARVGGTDGAGPWGGFALDPNALHIWPRGSAMMIALPNPDKSFTCTLFWPFEGEHSFGQLKTPEQVLAFFKEQYPDAVPLMPTLVEDFLRNPTSSLVTVRCWPWVYSSKPGKAVVLAGDAAHAIVPFYGQGMNAAFEDVRILCECLERHGGRGNWEAWIGPALEEYQTLRKPNADAIARMALDNFVEMRDKVALTTFKYRKKLEHLLHDLMPEVLTPKYNLVSFTTVPYAEALRRGARMDRVVRGLGLLAGLLVVCALWGVGVPRWFVMLGLLVAAWVVWDRWKTQEATRV